MADTIVDTIECSFEKNDDEFVVDYLLAHKMLYVQEFLKSKDLSYSGTKEKLRNRLNGYLSDGKISNIELINLLDKIEGWGNQHIYLYISPDNIIKLWQTEELTRGRLKKHNLDELLNQKKPILLPEKPTLSSIEWNPERMRFFWIEKRIHERKIPEKDKTDEEEKDLLWKAYKIMTSRGVIVFEWDLISGHAMLMIQRLQSRDKYHQIKGRFLQELDPIIGISNFETVRVSKAIKQIENSGEARKRQLTHCTILGGKVKLSSDSRKTDLYADPQLKESRKALGKDITSWLGNFYFSPDQGCCLNKEIHVLLYAEDQRVGIFGECREEEVRYILSKIRKYCQ